MVDEDVKVWAAARKLGAEKPDFTVKELLEQLQRQFKIDPKKSERFVVSQCVANAAPAPGPHFNYLFRTGPGKLRLYRAGDPIEVTRAGAPTMPPLSKIPEQFKALASQRGAATGVGKAAGMVTEPEVSWRPKPAKTAEPKTTGAGRTQAQLAELPHRGLQVDPGALDEMTVRFQARKTVFDMFFLEFGKVGSRLESTQGDSFVVDAPGLSGTAYTLRNQTVRLPSGTTVSHVSDIAIELDSPARTLFMDFVEAGTRPLELKARAFDAMHLKQESKNRHGVLVYLRTPAGMLQEQAEAVAYPFDFFFGAEAMDAKNPNKFYALKSHVLNWMNGKVKRA